jgi:hypothetical protein
MGLPVAANNLSLAVEQECRIGERTRLSRRVGARLELLPTASYVVEVIVTCSLANAADAVGLGPMITRIRPQNVLTQYDQLRLIISGPVYECSLARRQSVDRRFAFALNAVMVGLSIWDSFQPASTIYFTAQYVQHSCYVCCRV